MKMKEDKGRHLPPLVYVILLFVKLYIAKNRKLSYTVNIKIYERSNNSDS